MKESKNKFSKFYNIITIGLAAYLGLMALLLLLVKVRLPGGLSFVAWIFYALVLGIIVYGYPLIIVLFAVSEYFLEKHKQNIQEKGFHKELIPLFLPTFIVNSVLLTLIGVAGNYVLINYLDIF